MLEYDYIMKFTDYNNQNQLLQSNNKLKKTIKND